MGCVEVSTKTNNMFSAQFSALSATGKASAAANNMAVPEDQAVAPALAAQASRAAAATKAAAQKHKRARKEKVVAGTQLASALHDAKSVAAKLMNAGGRLCPKVNGSESAEDAALVASVLDVAAAMAAVVEQIKKHPAFPAAPAVTLKAIDFSPAEQALLDTYMEGCTSIQRAQMKANVLRNNQLRANKLKTFDALMHFYCGTPASAVVSDVTLVEAGALSAPAADAEAGASPEPLGKRKGPGAGDTESESESSSSSEDDE